MLTKQNIFIFVIALSILSFNCQKEGIYLTTYNADIVKVIVDGISINFNDKTIKTDILKSGHVSAFIATDINVNSLVQVESKVSDKSKGNGAVKITSVFKNESNQFESAESNEMNTFCNNFECTEVNIGASQNAVIEGQNKSSKFLFTSFDSSTTLLSTKIRDRVKSKLVDVNVIGHPKIYSVTIGDCEIFKSEDSNSEKNSVKGTFLCDIKENDLVKIKAYSSKEGEDNKGILAFIKFEDEDFNQRVIRSNLNDWECNGIKANEGKLITEIKNIDAVPIWAHKLQQLSTCTFTYKKNNPRYYQFNLHFFATANVDSIEIGDTFTYIPDFKNKVHLENQNAIISNGDLIKVSGSYTPNDKKHNYIKFKITFIDDNGNEVNIVSSNDWKCDGVSAFYVTKDDDREQYSELKEVRGIFRKESTDKILKDYFVCYITYRESLE